MTTWFLLQIKPREELRAEENLQRQGIVTYHPRVDVTRVRRGKKTVVNEALFPGYMFIQGDPDKLPYPAIRSTRGVSKFVSFGINPTQIDEQLIVALKDTLASDNAPNITTLPKSGDCVEILDGPFRGLNAIFSEPVGETRCIVLINFLNGAAKATFELNQIKNKD